MRRLGVARVIERGRYTPQRVARRLESMLAEPLLAERAEQAAERLRQEDGVRSACDALEELDRSRTQGK
jgi:UDP:flavonoid glycosyltransferase YjiC (YdhE family)